ncbi:MAG: M81 family metallopeptidase [Bryobacteraceae bacterium]|nr:M81 family metallopeptidase [Bryobacteraceae bacterium]MDW8378399.1 M81 family metallopeptidase [Bryobacterales bacterium]
MKRILILECKQEISSFNPVLGQYEDFEIARGEQLLTMHRGVRTEVGGALQVLEGEAGLVGIGGYSARGVTSGGTLAEEAWRRIAGEFLEAVWAHRDVDGMYFCLHGALASEREDDAEGYLLEQSRRIVGEKMPVVTSLDLHGVLTDRILRHSDAVVVYHTYPHVDFFETGQRAARLLVRLLRGEVRPVAVRVAIPALVRGDELKTATGRWGQCVRAAVEFENSKGGLSGGVLIGNPFTDVPDLCSNVLLVADGEVGRAEAEAVRIAREFWDMRHALQQPLKSLEECVEAAARAKGRVVLVDAADATSSGATGDSNAILCEMRKRGYSRTVLAPIVDPRAVQAAFQAGVGAELEVAVGGALDPQRFKPVAVRAAVRMLSDGVFRSESDGTVWRSGPTAVLQTGATTLVVTSRAVNLYDRSLFFAHGLDPAHFETVVVKSPHCQRHMFEEGAELILNVDAPGSTSAKLHSLGHRRCRRPIFPLDAEFPFEPVARVFRRWGEG